MATYAVGDVQGCFASLQSLLAALRFDAAHDRLWLCGDLVNRGPDSLATLRWAAEQGPSVRMVLGNHDLKLLSMARNLVRPSARDTLADILSAPDRDALLAWLQAQPLLAEVGDHLLIHAGLLPSWSLATARTAAAQAQVALQETPEAFLRAYSTPHARLVAPQDAEDPFCAAVFAAKVLTLLRVCTGDDVLHLSFSGAPEAAKDGLRPWFAWPSARPRSPTVVCGHWSALGLYRGEGIVALDSGCVWGRQLSALTLETGALTQVDAADFTSPQRRR